MAQPGHTAVLWAITLPKVYSPRPPALLPPAPTEPDADAGKAASAKQAANAAPQTKVMDRGMDPPVHLVFANTGRTLTQAAAGCHRPRAFFRSHLEPRTRRCACCRADHADTQLAARIGRVASRDGGCRSRPSSGRGSKPAAAPGRRRRRSIVASAAGLRAVVLDREPAPAMSTMRRSLSQDECSASRVSSRPRTSTSSSSAAAAWPLSVERC